MKNEQLLKRTAIIALIYSVIAMGVMIAFMVYRGDPVEVMASEEVSSMDDLMNSETGILIENGEEKKTEYLCIPLPENITEKEITLRDDYNNHKVSIVMEGVDKNFFYENPLSGSCSHIKDLLYGYGDQMARIDLILDGIYDRRVIYENGKMYIQFVAPRELYKQIVVIDPGHGGESEGTTSFGQTEKDITLDIVLKLKKMLDNTEIKVYYTRLEDVNVDAKSRVMLANQTKADMFISIHANADPKTRTTNGTRTMYGSKFFIPQFGSKELAETLQKQVVLSTENKDKGIQQQDEIYLLNNITIPAVLVEVGYLTNKQEALKMGRDDYREKIAEGIYQGILEAYEEMTNG